MIRIGETAAAVELKLRELGFTVNALEVDGVGIEPTAPAPATAAPVAASTSTPERPRRHLWVKLREHTYVCQTCGAGRVNEQAGREWFTTWHLPTGWSGRLPRTAPCVPGPRTEAALRKHAAAIVAFNREKGTEAK